MRTASLFALALTALACSTSPESTPPPLPGSLSNGEVLGGQMNVESLLIPAGFTVWVESDLHLTATGPIRIEGQLVARDADFVDALDAPSIALSSSSVVDITGAVLGGRGAEGVVTRGGRGSSVVITAPLVHIDGQVQAGSGGAGGPSHSGGSGGDALVHGVFNVRKDNAGFTLRSGRGGAGGFPGGSGGDSGAALAGVPAELRH